MTDDDVGGSVGGVSCMGEKPYLPDEADLRGGDRPRSDSPLGLPFVRPFRNGLRV